MHRCIALLVLVVAGCASSRPSDEATGGTIQTTRVHTGSGRTLEAMNVTDPSVRTATLPAPIDRVWTQLAGVFAELDIPITIADTLTHTMGTRGSTFRRRLAGDKLSAWVECGVTAMGLRNADSYSVRLEILARLESLDSARTLVRTQVRGDAAAEGTSEARVRCASNGRLEKRISDLVAERLAGK